MAGVMALPGGLVVSLSVDPSPFLEPWASPSPLSDPTALPSPSVSPSAVASVSPGTSVQPDLSAWTPEAVNGVLLALALLVFFVAAGVVGNWSRA